MFYISLYHVCIGNAKRPVAKVTIMRRKHGRGVFIIPRVEEAVEFSVVIGDFSLFPLSSGNWREYCYNIAVLQNDGIGFLGLFV